MHWTTDVQGAEGLGPAGDWGEDFLISCLILVLDTMEEVTLLTYTEGQVMAICHSSKSLQILKQAKKGQLR